MTSGGGDISTWVAFWSVLPVMGPLLSGLVALQGSPRAVRVGLTLGSVSSLLAVGALWPEVAGGNPVYHPLGGWGAPLGIELRVDGLALLMLAVTAVVGSGVNLFSTSYFGDVSALAASRAPAGRAARYFAPLWLLLWAALNGIFVSGDLFNLYVMLEIVGLAAAALVTLAVTSQAAAAGIRYLLISLAGSMVFLLGVALLYLAAGTLSLSGLAALPLTGAVPMVALALMTVGLAAKTALFPLHGWLPGAHAAAPAPASALLSALVVKGSFYILLRLWVQVFHGGTVEALQLLGLLGAGAILWGSILALRQRSLKRLIAYSTVAQLGYLFVMFPLLHPAPGVWSPEAWAGGVYHMISHAVAKAAMFLAAGSMSFAAARDDLTAISGVAQRHPMTFLAFGLGGLSLAGIPPTGGFLAKWLLLQAAVEAEAWGWLVILAAGGLLTAAYVLMVMRWAVEQGQRPPESFRAIPRRMEWSALALALLAVALGLRAVELLELLGTGPLPLIPGAGPMGGAP